MEKIGKNSGFVDSGIHENMWWTRYRFGYVAHETPKSKHGHVLSSTIMDVLQKTNSISTLNILAMDGENSNSGAHSKC